MMGSQEMMVPIIDFSSKELKPGTSTWESVKAQVRSALEEFGCFQALYDKIPEYNVRFMKYKPPNNTDGTEIGLASHTDKTLVSILDQYGTKGLQVLTKDGQWIQVNFPPNTFCVLLGEIIHAWSNGRLPAPFHRVVMNSGKESRYTTGLFSNVKEDYTVKAPEELVDEDHPRQFKPFQIPGLIACWGYPSYTEEGISKSDIFGVKI